MNPWIAFLVRLAASLACGWLVARIFFPREGPYMMLLLAGIVLGAAYVSMWLKNKRGDW